MRICILTQYYPPEIGAPQNRLSFLAEKMAAGGHEVTVLTAMPSYPQGKIYPGYGGFFRREKLNGVEVLRTWIIPCKSSSVPPRFIHHMSFVLSSLIAGLRLLQPCDYLFVESPPLMLGMTAVILSRLSKARMIFNVSDLWPESAVHLGKISRQNIIYWLAERFELFCYRKAWLVSGQSREILKSIQERFKKANVYHFSNSVDVKRFAGKKSVPMREKLGKEACIAVYAGLHGRAQGLDQILYAANRLKDLKSLGFVLVGDGPDKESLVAQSQKFELSNVRFLDPQNSEDMPSLLSAADIALIPLAGSIPGAVPSKLYEAMACSLPVLLIANGEAAEIVKDAGAGMVVEPQDVPKLCHVLQDLANQPEKRRGMGRAGQTAAQKYFDREKITASFIRHLEASLTR